MIFILVNHPKRILAAALLALVALTAFRAENQIAGNSSAATATAAITPEPAVPAATSPAIQNVTELKVVIKAADPFVIINGHAAPSGYAIDLWEEVARLCKYHTQYQVTTTMEGMLSALEQKRADVAVGAVSLTHERETRVDLSHSIFDSGFGLLVKSHESWQWILSFILNPRLLIVVGVLIVGFFILGNIIYFCHLAVKPEDWPQNYIPHVFEGMWWAANSFIGTGMCNLEVKGVLLRTIASVWMVIGIMCISIVTATFASLLTVAQLNSDVKDLSQLKGTDVATVQKSLAATYLDSKGMSPVLCPDLGAAIKQLEKGKVRAVFYDIPLLEYQLKQGLRDEEISLLPMTYLPHQYGFALELQSHLTKQINGALLELRENGTVEKLREKWFGEEAR